MAVITKFNDDILMGEVSDLSRLGIDAGLLLFDARGVFDEGGEPNQPMLDNLVENICENILQYGRRVFIFCDGGIDRSPFVVWCVLETLGDWDAQEDAGAIYHNIKFTRPQIIEHFEWVSKRVQWMKEMGLYI